jgi:uncharacterized membrane protein
MEETKKIKNDEGAKLVKEKRKGRGKVIYLIIIVILALGLLWSLTSYLNARKQISILSDPQKKAEVEKVETDALLASIGQHIILAKDEEPMVATIKDIENLSAKEPFYKDAKDGDKIIIYPESQRAIIYNPENDILVNVGVIVNNQ